MWQHRIRTHPYRSRETKLYSEVRALCSCPLQVDDHQRPVYSIGVSWDTIKDIQKRYLKRKFGRPSLSKVRFIGIDEFAVQKGHRYMTIVVDLERGEVLHVGDGKGMDALTEF